MLDWCVLIFRKLPPSSRSRVEGVERWAEMKHYRGDLCIPPDVVEPQPTKIYRIRVLLGFIRVYFSEGDLRGRNVPQEERGKRKDVLGGRRRS